MKPGKQICETLKGIRVDIARANHIEYHPVECNHKGDCDGTCPACESEVRWLERQLRLRQQLGKAVTIAGLSLGVSALTSCSVQTNGHMAKDPSPTEIRLEGDVAVMPPDSVEPVSLLDSIQAVEQCDTLAAPSRPNHRRTTGMVRRVPDNDTTQTKSAKKTKSEVR